MVRQQLRRRPSGFRSFAGVAGQCSVTNALTVLCEGPILRVLLYSGVAFASHSEHPLRHRRLSRQGCAAPSGSEHRDVVWFCADPVFWCFALFRQNDAIYLAACGGQLDHSSNPGSTSAAAPVRPGGSTVCINSYWRWIPLFRQRASRYRHRGVFLLFVRHSSRHPLSRHRTS
jgi:hypothetical protein